MSEEREDKRAPWRKALDHPGNFIITMAIFLPPLYFALMIFIAWLETKR